MRKPSGTLTFDVESFSASELYTLPPEKMFRIGGYRWRGESEVVITTDLEEMREMIRRARWIVGHNIHMFDLKVIFGCWSNEPVKFAMAGRVYDTLTHAGLVNQAPYKYMSRHGYELIADTPGKAMKWFGLDEQAYQLGVSGKTDDLAALAKEFVEPGEDISLGYGRIPLDDPRYQAYLVGDVEASERVAAALLKRGKLSGGGETYEYLGRKYVGYPMREQEIAARAAVISSNGWLVDEQGATARRDELAARRDVIVGELERDYGLPTEGDAPWDTNEGKAAILTALADRGITPENTPDWPKTPADSDKKRAEFLEKVRAKIEKRQAEVDEWRAELEAGVSAKSGRALTRRSVESKTRRIAEHEAEIAALEADPWPVAYGLSLGGETLIELTKDTDAEELGAALAELKGQRSLAQLTLDSIHPDGRVHPDITMVQASGRWSTTKPGLTVWTARGPGRVERDYYLPDSEDDLLVSFDYSNADARAVAAESGDVAFAERFQPGKDGHLINAWAAWGKDVVGTDKHDPVTAKYRDQAKPGGHAWGYRVGPPKLAKLWKKPVAEAKLFLDNMNKAFRGVVAWQDAMVKFARRHGYVVNDWGRVMRVEKGREYTQAPALIGQSTTREIICDALLKMPLPVLRRVKAQIHDELVMSIPKKNIERHQAYVLNLMNYSHLPKHGKGQRIDFPASSGAGGATWMLATHD
ncbi:DNA polymerase [Amycolatopsis sp. NPDC003731]